MKTVTFGPRGLDDTTNKRQQFSSIRTNSSVSADSARTPAGSAALYLQSAVATEFYKSAGSRVREMPASPIESGRGTC